VPVRYAWALAAGRHTSYLWRGHGHGTVRPWFIAVGQSETVVSETQLALILSGLAVALIASEWAYVILWTRTAGKSIVSSISRVVVGLRAARGKGPTMAETLADQAPPPTASPAGPKGASAELNLDQLDLDSPIAQQFMGRIADQFGLDPQLVRSYAEQVVGPNANPAPSPGGSPAYEGENGAEPPPRRAAPDPFGALLGGLLSGKVGMEDALVTGAPMVWRALSHRGGPTGDPPGYW